MKPYTVGRWITWQPSNIVQELGDMFETLFMTLEF